MPFKEQIYNLKNEIVVILIMFLTFTTPIQGMFWLVGMAVSLDTSYAIYYSIKKFGIRSITSHNLFNSAIKTFFYMSTILLGYLASIHITEGVLFGIKLFLPKFICAFWLYIELKSIDETSVKLGNHSFVDVVKNVIKWLKQFKKDLNEIK